jgi:hypothetical protein
LLFKVSRILSACPLVMNIDSREKFKTFSILCKCSTPRKRGQERREKRREEERGQDRREVSSREREAEMDSKSEGQTEAKRTGKMKISKETLES